MHLKSTHHRPERATAPGTNVHPPPPPFFRGRNGAAAMTRGIATLALAGAVLALLAPAPAQAQTTCTLNTGDIWCGVVTVEEWMIGGSPYGDGFEESEMVGDLSVKDFTYGMNSYTIDAIVVEKPSGTLEGGILFSLTSALTTNDKDALALHVGSIAIEFGDASYQAAGHHYTWEGDLQTTDGFTPGPGLDWTSETTVVVRLREELATPTITGVAVTSTPLLETDTYGAGEDIEFSVTFSEAVEVTGNPQFGFSLAGARLADYDAGSGSSTLKFVYTVQPADRDADGIWVGNHATGNVTLQLDADDAITSVGGANANLEHDRLQVLSGHKVDGSRTAEDPVEVTLHLSDSDGEVGEDAVAVTVTATVSPASASAFIVTVSVSAVAPATDDDFTLSSNRVLSFAENATESTGTVTIAPVDDGDPEANQVVTVSGSASIAGVTGPDDVILTIVDDDLVRISGICNRTQRVEDRILVRLKYVHDFEGRCGDVTETHLAKLTLLDLRRNPSNESAFTLSLRPDDFEGLSNLVELDLADTRLGSLPAGVFDGLASLETLNLNKNRLRSLPAWVFAGLTSLETLRLYQNPSLRTLPYDEFEALPALTTLRVDREGRRKLQVAGGEGDAALEVAAGGSATYDVRLMSAPDFRVTAASPVRIGVSSDASAGVVATPATLRFTRENWFRSQTVTVRVLSSASGTVVLEHEASGTTTDSHGQAQSNYDFEDYPLPTVTVRVPESDRGERALTGRFTSPPDRHDGTKRIKVRVAFSEPIDETPKRMREHGVRVQGGAVTSARPVGGQAPGGAGTRSAGSREVVWEFEIKPDSGGDVTVSFEAGRPCGEPGAICTADGRALSEGISTTVRGPAAAEQEPQQQEQKPPEQEQKPQEQAAAAEQEPQQQEQEQPEQEEAAAAEQEPPQKPPPAPRNLTGVANGDGSVTLSWDAPGDDSVTGYRILRRHTVKQARGVFSTLVANTGTTATTYTDRVASPETRYAYRVKAVNAAGAGKRSNFVKVTTKRPAPASKPALADGPPGLAPNAPNPFNASTLIPYRLDADGPVRLVIYNLLGQSIRTLVDEAQAAGAYRVRWDARDGRGAAVAAGVYFIRLHYPDGVQTRRMLYLE